MTAFNYSIKKRFTMIVKFKAWVDGVTAGSKLMNLLIVNDKGHIEGNVQLQPKLL